VSRPDNDVSSLAHCAPDWRASTRLCRLARTVSGSAATSFRFRPPATGNNKAVWRRSRAVFFGFFAVAAVRFGAAGFCARLRFKAAIRSMTGAGFAISLGLTGSPLILASTSSRNASSAYRDNFEALRNQWFARLTAGGERNRTFSSAGDGRRCRCFVRVGAIDRRRGVSNPFPSNGETSTNRYSPSDRGTTPTILSKSGQGVRPASRVLSHAPALRSTSYPYVVQRR
jgi:hypothetical protein